MRVVEGSVVTFAFECPRTWEALAPTADVAMRRCDDCARPVYLARDAAEARAHGAAGRCVTVLLAASGRDGAPPPSKTGMLTLPEPGPVPFVGWLVPLDGPRTGETIRLLDHRTNLGRAPDNHVALDLPGISGWHARITRTGDGFVLEDLSTANGTYVNLRRIERILLADGDLIAFHRYRLVFKAILPPAPALA